MTADLSQLWEEHTKHEFATRDTEATLATMVEDAYVNHVPVMTGGSGKTALRDFYSRYFIPSMPPSSQMTIRIPRRVVLRYRFGSELIGGGRLIAPTAVGRR